MRKALFAVSALAFSTSALAASPMSRDAERMADTLNNPATQAVAAGALDAMLAAVLDMRIDGIAKALEPLNKGKPIRMHGRTIRELAQRDDPRFEDKMQRGTRQAISSMGALASALAAAMPELERAARKFEDSLPEGR